MPTSLPPVWAAFHYSLSLLHVDCTPRLVFVSPYSQVPSPLLLHTFQSINRPARVTFCLHLHPDSVLWAHKSCFSLPDDSSLCKTALQPGIPDAAHQLPARYAFHTMLAIESLSFGLIKGHKTKGRRVGFFERRKGKKSWQFRLKEMRAKWVLFWVWKLNKKEQSGRFSWVKEKSQGLGKEREKVQPFV